ncbi:MAG: alpha/beta fold hydrolase [Candidatus Binatia bacterium]
MPIVLVHGVPETNHLWNGVRASLARNDVIVLSLPGFGCPRPAGFGSTKEEYVDWLIGEFEKIGKPVDLVGHDWGGGFTIRVASLRPDLLRSWVSDAAGLSDVDFEWHEFAKIWQTPGAGEEFWKQQLAMSVDERAATFTSFGVPLAEARDLTSRIDRTMADSILALYRSAVDVGREWAPAIKDITTPGLVVIPELDPFLHADKAEASAKQAGSKVVRLAGLGHWWALQDPKRGAEMLTDFWKSL